jgi:hypothetical protein
MNNTIKRSNQMMGSPMNVPPPSTNLMNQNRPTSNRPPSNPFVYGNPQANRTMPQNNNPNNNIMTPINNSMNRNNNPNIINNRPVPNRPPTPNRTVNTMNINNQSTTPPNMGMQNMQNMQGSQPNMMNPNMNMPQNMQNMQNMQGGQPNMINTNMNMMNPNMQGMPQPNMMNMPQNMMNPDMQYMQYNMQPNIDNQEIPANMAPPEEQLDTSLSQTKGSHFPTLQLNPLLLMKNPIVSTSTPPSDNNTTNSDMVRPIVKIVDRNLPSVVSFKNNSIVTDTISWTSDDENYYVKLEDEKTILIREAGIYSIYASVNNVSPTGSTLMIIKEGSSNPLSTVRIHTDTSLYSQIIYPFKNEEKIQLKLYMEESSLKNCIAEVILIKWT